MNAPPNDHIPGWEDPRRVLARHGLRPNRSFSQNFLVARPVVDAIVSALDLGATGQKAPKVVELGPGLGTLTAALLRAGAAVTAVERDPAMRAVLAAELGHVSRLRVVAGDAAQVDLAALVPEQPPTVAGNLPYAVTGAILRRLVDQVGWIAKAVVMVQREVGDRLRAAPGSADYGAATVFVSNVCDVSRVRTVSAGCFHPPPRVESAVIQLAPRPHPRVPTTRAFETVVRAAFQQRRKTLRNALRRVVASGGNVDRMLEEAGIDGGRRGETLSVEAFGALARSLAAGSEKGPLPPTAAKPER